MNKILTSLFLFFPILCMAQEEVAVAEVTPIEEAKEANDQVKEQPQLHFGIVNKTAILENMSEYTKVEQDIENLKANFETEAKRSADEFNAKYETFLNEQRNYAPSIMRKRQAELEEMMRSNENFRNESRRMLRDAREKALKPLREKINNAIAAVAEENGLLFVLNSDRDAVPYYNNVMGVDITEQVKAKCQ